MSQIVEHENPTGSLPAQWQTSLVIDVAMGVSKEVICEAYDLQYPQLKAIIEMPSFSKRLEEMERELAKEGASFRLKSQMQAEEYLKTSYQMVTDNDLDPKVRADLIKSTARWAGFDAPSQAGVGSTGGISISINLGQADKEIDGRVVSDGN
jgi:hypothetical protein